MPFSMFANRTRRFNSRIGSGCQVAFFTPPMAVDMRSFL